MNKVLKTLIGYCLFVVSHTIYAEQKIVSVGVAHFPPYSIVEGDKISGVEVDIVRESLKIMGYQAKFISYPYGRLPITFSTKKVDSTIVTLKNFKDPNVYYSDIVLPQYQTVAVHLKKNNFTISAIEDLNKKSIVAHQRANLYYGKEYKQISESKNTKYQETAWQYAQVRMLFSDRVDVIVLAHEIFLYFKAQATYEGRDKNYLVSKIFGKKFGFHNAFWNKEVRDDFNTGLARIKKNGTYEQILTHYLKVYKLPVNVAQ